ncbi:hypothetical protein JW848_09070 [Candidatus Bipolaricaulota bacterium]|nr:hypothetical protein [Candidatus Bipolaricaulota bacterium]
MNRGSKGRITVIGVAIGMSIVLLLGVAAVSQGSALTVWELPYEDAFPGGIALGPDGTVYAAANGGQEVYRLDPANDLFRSWGVGDRPADVTVIDGTVFCTIENDDGIVYFDPAGLAVSTAVIPFPGVAPREIHRGTDTAAGNIILWIVERGVPGVLRLEYNPATDGPSAAGQPSEQPVVPQTLVMTPQMVQTTYERFPYDISLMPTPVPLAVSRTAAPFTEWALPISGFSVEDIAVADDGTLWISIGAPLLFRFDPIAGTLQEMETIRNVAIFQGLLPAADGSIWFGNIVEGSVGHFDPALGLSEVWRIPGTGEIYDLVFGADGSIWYTDRVGDAIGRLNTATGQATIYPLPADSEPLYLQIDADGAVWFTAGSGNSIGRLTVAN